eukprot:559965-Pyramimonas_sp.AAC.1
MPCMFGLRAAQLCLSESSSSKSERSSTDPSTISTVSMPPSPVSSSDKLMCEPAIFSAVPSGGPGRCPPAR